MTTATAATVAAPFALELQALKADLQRTLARLGTAPVRMRESPASPWSHASTTTATSANTTTPTTVRSDATSRRSRASPSQSEMTERILHELVATARRRRQVEMHMARELERELRVREDELLLPWGRSAPRDTSRATSREDGKESAIRSEIEALRLRRKQILVEIDNESKSEEPAPAANKRPLTMQDRSSESSAGGADVSNVSASIKRHNEHEYSIEGVVKLGSLMNRQTNQEAASQTSPSLSRHHGLPQHAPQVPSLHSSQLYGGYRNQHHDKMMQDVFAIQLKFAETMLQLEKSIQTRDQLLVSTSTDRVRRRSVTSRRSAAVSMRRRTRRPSTIHEDRERNPADSSDDESGLSHALSSDDASMSEDTMRMWRRYRRRSASSPGTAPESVTTTTTTSTSPSQPSPGQASNHDPASPLVSTPSGDLLVTPTTNDSGNKQVHFHDTTDDYPTPLVARNISFDQDSIDSTDDDQVYARTMRRTMTTPTARAAPRKRLTVVSWDEDDALSFLEGSSVCSADLQDESFLAAFYALRRELLGDRLGTQTPPKPSNSSPALPAYPELIEATTTSQHPQSTVPTGNAAVSGPTVAAVDVAALQRQKRGLMLDIQASTAKLVLAQDAAQREQATAALNRLRRQLQTIEAQETAAAPL